MIHLLIETRTPGFFTLSPSEGEGRVRERARSNRTINAGRALRLTTVVLAVLLGGTLFASSLRAADAPWHAPEHSHRAVVRVHEAGSEGVDVAAVRLLHGGHVREDANDYRIFNAAGEAVPYEVTYHHPDRDSLISFRSGEPQGTFYIYHGHAEAERDPRRTIVPEQVGSGAPAPGPAADGWQPRAGLVLTTMRRPTEMDNPQTLEAIRQLIAASPGRDGAAYRANIADGFNPFGDSDHYISVYRGWLRVPKAGTYSFATVSNEASFSYIDGETLVHWPGRHTDERGRHGQMNAEHTLEAGVYHIEYLHEEVLLQQMAYLGYKSAGTAQYAGIPNDWFVQPHRARVEQYQQRGPSATVRIRAELIDSVWPTTRPLGQYTRYRFTADVGSAGDALDGWRITWDFGDGHRAAGASAEHVYLALGEYRVTLTATDAQGNRHEQHWPLTVFAIEHLEGPFRAGRYADHAPIVQTYDAAALSVSALVQLAHFWQELGDAPRAASAAEALLTREEVSGADRATAHLIAAGDAGLPHHFWQRGDAPAAAERAAKHLRSAVDTAEQPATKLHALARLIRHAGIAERHAERAQQLYDEAEALVQSAGLDRRSHAAYREAAYALGDAMLIARHVDAAREAYRKAEALAQPVVPVQVRTARIGGYPETIAQHLAANRIDAAQQVVDEWQHAFPEDRLSGRPMFWAGKVLLAREAYEQAKRPLQWAIELGGGAGFEAEARWLLAEAHGRTGDAEARQAALEALVRTGLSGDHRERAIAALREEQD